MVSSGRTPKESGPHSFRRDCHTLKRTPLLMPLVLDKGSSTSIIDSFVKLSAGFLWASGNTYEVLRMIEVVKEGWEVKF